MSQELLTTDNTYYVELHEALVRLEKNEDFKKVILQGYLEDKALSSVSLLGRPEIRRNNDRGSVIEELVAISNLNYYLMMVHNMGTSALVDIEEAEAKERGE